MIFGVDPDPRIHDSDLWIRVRIRIRIIDLQDAKKHLKKSFSAHYFLKIHLHHFSKD
jgi:hypothetical protein